MTDCGLAENCRMDMKSKTAEIEAASHMEDALLDALDAIGVLI